MDKKRRRLYVVFSLQLGAVDIHHYQVGWQDLRPQQPLRIDQKRVCSVAERDGKTEVIANPLMQSKLSCKSQSAGEVYSRRGQYAAGTSWRCVRHSIWKSIHFKISDFEERNKPTVVILYGR